ncbi:MAG TPA: biosynthetic peptidoglycan transglycosylase [Steroidobacteraceae bacterium]|nr:biosynthetic peptidoglycan transglycosylase [Steroidobacteraceae bacterium]
MTALPRRWRAVLVVIALLACIPLALLSITCVLLLVWLAPAPQDWAHTLRIGPVERQLSMQKLLRLATQPGVAQWFDGLQFRSSAGRWRLHELAGGTFAVECKPCVLHWRALGDTSVTVASAELRLRRVGRDSYAGTLQLRQDGRAVAVGWQAQVDAGGLSLLVTSGRLPLADLVPVLAPGLPERGRVTIAGTLEFTMRLRLPDGSLQMAPRIENFDVAGLGTERLLDVALPTNCQQGSRRALRGWLPSAVIAAEDQSFRTHPGYDLAGIMAAMQGNDRPGAALRGGSTLTQQLAKLLFTGDDRSLQRKLRELLYAVEMERTLGKARILQLYLALAPWGQGVCGAEQAARTYLGKPAALLDPLESAWLAGLLTNPEVQLRCQAQQRAVDAQQTERILNGMRPMAAWRRKRAVAGIGSFQPAVLRTPQRPYAPSSSCRTRLAASAW